MSRGSASWRWLAIAAAVLVVHGAGTVLSGAWIGGTALLGVSTAVAGWLWLVVRGAGRPVSGRVRVALLTVWLAPVALLWAAAGVAQVSAGFFPSRPPDTDGIIEKVSASPHGGVQLRLRVAPVPKDEPDERARQLSGIVIVHVPPSARVRGEPPGGPQVGQRARVWSGGAVMLTFPTQEIAQYIEYGPPDG
jgi:hypothetical protein